MNVGFWIHSEFKISQPVRSVRFQEIMGCFNFGFWILGWGEEKPNGEFWMLNGGLKTMMDFGCWMLDGIQHS